MNGNMCIVLICLVLVLVSDQFLAPDRLVSGIERSSGMIEENLKKINVSNTNFFQNLADDSWQVVASTQSLIIMSLMNFSSIDDVVQLASQRQIKIGVHTVIGIDISFVEKKLGLNSTKHYRTERMDRTSADCWMGNVFEYFDFVISTDFFLPVLIRQNRDCYVTTPVFRTLEYHDLSLVSLSPFEIVLSNSKATFNDLVNYQVEIMNDMFKNLQISQQVCSSSTTHYKSHDFSVMRIDQQFTNISIEDFLFIVEYHDIENWTFNQTFTNLAIEIALQSNGYTIDKLNSMKRSFFSTKCYSCLTSSCMWQDGASPIASNADGVSIGGGISLFIALFFYWPSLILFRNRESIKVRLIVPYVSVLSPVFIMIIQIFQIIKPCYLLYQISVNFLSCWSIIIYFLITFRFVLLRNIYTIVRYLNDRQIKFLKWLVGKRVASIGSFLMGVFIGCLVSLVPLVGFYNEFFGNNAAIQCAFITFGITVAIAVLSLLAVVIHFLFKIPIILQRGLLFILFFDDPFQIKFDILFFSLNTIIITVYLFTNASQNYVYNIFAPLLSHNIGMLYRGGLVLIIEWIKTIYFRKDLRMTSQEKEDELIAHLENPEFFNLMKEFVTVETSPENLLLYEELKHIERKSGDRNPKLNAYELNHIYETYFVENTLYELNVGAMTKEQFHNLLTRSVTEDIRLQDLKDIIEAVLLKNMADAHLRLKQIPEYRKWEMAHKIYEEENDK